MILFLVQDIKKGEKLSKKNIKVIRPGMGLPPEYYNGIINVRVGSSKILTEHLKSL